MSRSVSKICETDLDVTKWMSRFVSGIHETDIDIYITISEADVDKNGIFNKRMSLKSGTTDTLKNRQDHRRKFESIVELEETVEKIERRKKCFEGCKALFSPTTR